MFKKILIANRGEIAVRVIRTCREMGIAAVALYDKSDFDSLHVRLADECVPVDSRAAFMDGELILKIAREKGADAIHPGYGFLAERPDFIEACAQANITFIGPAASVTERLLDKLRTLDMAREAGFDTVQNSPATYDANNLAVVQAAAAELSYPLVVKSALGGRGRGERLVRNLAQLPDALRRALVESRAVFGTERVYLEEAILPAHQVGVQILADRQGSVIHLGEREGSLLHSNQKLIEESPAPCLSQSQREAMWQTAVELARLFNYENAGTVEFLVDGDGRFYFSEFKARIQVEHPITEEITGVDLVREQILIAAGQPLRWQQADIRLRGCSILCRISAEDPWQDYMPSPGRLSRVRLPGGPGVRVDTYVYTGCRIPAQYDPLIAKLIVVAEDRAHSVERLRRALEDFALIGVPTNLPLVQRILQADSFIEGCYDTSFLAHSFETAVSANHLRDLAVAAAVYYLRRNQLLNPTMPERFQSGWHRDSRRLPQ